MARTSDKEVCVYVPGKGLTMVSPVEAEKIVKPVIAKMNTNKPKSKGFVKQNKKTVQDKAE